MPEQPSATLSTESANAELERLRAENAALRAQNAEQAAVIEQLRQRIAELDARLTKDSHNSNKPPSSDSPFKKPPPRSQRKPRGRKPGGQKGHPGSTLELVENPNERTIMPLAAACDCGCPCAEIAAEVLPKRRQVIEVEIRRQVVEYPTVSGTCACWRTHRSAFPETVSAPVQYGASVSALAVCTPHSTNCSRINAPPSCSSSWPASRFRWAPYIAPSRWRAIGSSPRYRPSARR